ncbi:hypothetical protein AJ79_09814 [Helicocarpus griseus UAMH5409]|uniref:Cytochrome P450 monooxygenase n=1 Tax=Helicocarpus griseus UAMH5409 TaxID=1447875 RepID=A0A2B7WH57_9EURO|nr:hypothetical protein AJ79_09814 [Helicocarpus griseus UAMH5409]
MLATKYQDSVFASILIGLIIALVKLLLPIWVRAIKLSRIPLADKRPGEFLDTKRKQRMVQNYRQILKDGLEKYPGGFQIAGETSRQIVIPPQYANFVNVDPRFTTAEPLDAFIKITFAGFEGSNSILGHTKSKDMFLTMMRSKINKNLGNLTEDLVDEASAAISETWGLENEWHELPLMSAVLSVVCRLSTRVFLGPDLCKNPDWLQLVVRYAINTFVCARTLRRYPEVIARIIQCFLKDCRVLRNQVATARRLLGPYIAKHLETVESARRGIADMPRDGIVWMHETANGQPYDPVIIQLGVSVTAIHTTTDLLTQTILDIVAHPEIITPLRKEIEQVVAEDGWRNMTLQKMKLLDSVVKETQRLKPASGATTGRYANEEITLPSGLVIPKGAFVFTSMQRMWDDEDYPDHEEWDGYRFYNKRKEPGKENSYQLVSTCPEHLGFGHGLHACPGRFLAAAEVKVALSYILMNYDLECATQEVPKPLINGMEFMSNPEAKLRVRRRKL